MTDQPASDTGLVAGRYRVERALGRGGMASVHQVVDERSGQRFALKRLQSLAQHDRNVRAMFEREYYGLAQLVHPNIVRVFDFGLDGDCPYYTMELLAGTDARQAVSETCFAIEQACLLLRDCACALALVHSRGMVHRDVSPRNLWCMPDGRAKLIDFGTLVSIGSQTRIAGTPPFVPPEAVNMQPLDARADLYALGALGYYLLTGKTAYPARTLAVLPDVWRYAPARPDALRPEIGRALSDLIMALLSLDARARPGSAADVYERLTVLAGLPSEDEQYLAQAFLTTPNLVGRNGPSELWRRRLQRALARSGGTVAIVGGPGVGRSRMLSSFVLDAKLTGATTTLIDARAVGSEPLGLTRALVEQLLTAQPLMAAQARSLAKVLGHLSQEVHAAFGSPQLDELPPAQRLTKLSAAAVTLLEIATRERPLVVAVDDVHRADGASLAVLGRLSLLAAERRALLVFSAETGAIAHAPPALERLLSTRHRIELEPLSAQDVCALLESVFGSIPGLDAAAGWLFELSRGNPQMCMQYAQYLVDQGAARYERGSWSLPQDLRSRGLPQTLGSMFDARVRSLSEDARALSLGLALARDESVSSWQPEVHVHLEDYPKLLASNEPARAFAALDELLRASVVQQRDRFYVLAQRPVIDALLRVATPDERRSVHARVAEIFLQPTYTGFGSLLGVRQLQLAGDDERAKHELIAHVVRNNNASVDWRAIRVSVTAACSRRALEHWQAHGGTPYEGIRLRGSLLSASSVYDWADAHHVDAQIERLRIDAGLVYWDQTDAALGDAQRVAACLARAQQAYAEAAESERGLEPLAALREIAAACISTVGAFVNAHEAARSRALPEILWPLRGLSPVIALIADMCSVALDRVTGRELGDGLLDIADRLLVAEGVPETLRHGAAVINLHIQSLEDARRGRVRGFSVLERLAERVGDDIFLVVHGRWLSHAFGGHATQAARLRRQAELITEDDVWRRRAYLFIEAELHFLCGDLQELTRVHASLAQLAQRFEGLRPWVAFAKGGIHRLRGELAAAERELAAGLSLAPAGEHRAFVRLAPAYAEVLLARGDTQGALREVLRLQAAVEAFTLDGSAALAAERIKALVDSADAQHAAARDSIERAFALAARLELGGLPLALLWETRARVALAADDAPGCSAALGELRVLIADAHAPALVHAYEALRIQIRRSLRVPAPPGLTAATRSQFDDSSTVYTELQTQLRSYETSVERAQRALALLLQESHAQAGHLLLVDDAGLYTAASHERPPPSAGLLVSAKEYFEGQVRDVCTVTVTDTGPGARVLSTDAGAFAPLLLSCEADGDQVIAGLVLIAVQPSTLRTPASELLQVVGRCLLVCGDSLGRKVEV